MPNIKWCYADSRGRIIIKIDGQLYGATLSDGAIVARLAERAQREPGKAFNEAKKYAAFEKLPS